MPKNLEVLFDDGGGIIVQCDGFVHSYDDPAHAAGDVAGLLANDDPSDWDGNEPEFRVADDQDRRDAIRNGGYEVMDEADLRAAIADTLPLDINGRARLEFLAALTGRAVAAT